MTSEAQKKANKKYQDANYEFIKVRLNKGDKEKLKAKVEKEGKSINSYILKRIL
jgi:predicted HicB family RNase H-like nuclease